MKSTRKHYEDLLDELWRICIAVRDDRICQYTFHSTGKKVPGKDAHHIFSRSHKSTRWNVTNGILLKPMHNRSDAHKNPEKFRRFIIEHWFSGHNEYDLLYSMSNSSIKYSFEDLERKKKILISHLKSLFIYRKNHANWVIERVKKFKKCWPITEEEKNRIIEQAGG